MRTAPRSTGAVRFCVFIKSLLALSCAAMTIHTLDLKRPLSVTNSGLFRASETASKRMLFASRELQSISLLALPLLAVGYRKDQKIKKTDECGEINAILGALLFWVLLRSFAGESNAESSSLNSISEGSGPSSSSSSSSRVVALVRKESEESSRFLPLDLQKVTDLRIRSGHCDKGRKKSTSCLLRQQTLRPCASSLVGLRRDSLIRNYER